MSTPYFVSYQNSDSSSSVFSRDINSAFYVYSGYYPQQTYNYTIYVPTQIANDLGPDYENIIRSIADIYNFESLLYSVTIY